MKQAAYAAVDWGTSSLRLWLVDRAGGVLGERRSHEGMGQGDSSKPLPAKATQELPAELLALLEQKKMPKYSPIVVRLFKEEAELEVWKQDTTGRFQILKTYPICRWSGDLGPKLYEGDRQAPEGFYTITPELMNPNSNYYLSINFGFPNTFDKANKRSGSFLMIHGPGLLVRGK